MGLIGFKPIPQMILFICITIAFTNVIHCDTAVLLPGHFKDNTQCNGGEPPRTPEQYASLLKHKDQSVRDETKTAAEKAKEDIEYWHSSCESKKCYYNERIGQNLCGHPAHPAPGPAPPGPSRSATPNSSSIQVMTGIIVAIMVADLNLC